MADSIQVVLQLIATFAYVAYSQHIMEVWKRPRSITYGGRPIPETSRKIFVVLVVIGFTYGLYCVWI